MSTKIYNGYKITAFSLDEAVGKLFNNKENFKKLIENKIQEDILTKAINNYYEMCFSNLLEKNTQYENKTAFGDLISKALENESNINIKERDTVDISICLLPQKKIENNEEYYLLMLFAGEYAKLIKESDLWKSLGIKEFAYWNNSDKPEELTDYEWKIRAKQWDNGLGDKTPAENSLIIELKKEYKYTCTYFRNKEDLQVIFENNFNLINEDLSKQHKFLLNYYKELLQDKMAYKACSKNFSIESLDILTETQKKELKYEAKDYTKNNKFTELEKSEMQEILNKMQKIFTQTISFESLFEKNETIGKNIKNTLKNNKFKI